MLFLNNFLVFSFLCCIAFLFKVFKAECHERKHLKFKKARLISLPCIYRTGKLFYFSTFSYFPFTYHLLLSCSDVKIKIKSENEEQMINVSSVYTLKVQCVVFLLFLLLPLILIVFFTCLLIYLCFFFTFYVKKIFKKITLSSWFI